MVVTSRGSFGRRQERRQDVRLTRDDGLDYAPCHERGTNSNGNAETATARYRLRFCRTSAVGFGLTPLILATKPISDRLTFFR